MPRSRYQAEVSTPESRGFMVSMHGIMFAVGYGFSSWIGFGVYFISAGGSTSSFPWRFPLAFQAAPALIMLAGSHWLPYSPRWLMQKSRFDEAEAVLKRLHARKGEEHGAMATKEFYQMRKQLEYERQIKAKISPFEVFKTPSNRKRALIAAVMMWFNMVSGPRGYHCHDRTLMVESLALVHRCPDHCELRHDPLHSARP